MEGAIFSVGLGCGGQGPTSFRGPGKARRPRRRDRSGLLRESARRGRHGEGGAGRARRLSPQGSAGCSAGQARPVRVGGREPRSGTARPAHPLPRPAETRRSLSEHDPRPRRPGAPPESGARRHPHARRRVPSVLRARGFAWAPRRARELTPRAGGGARVSGSGPRAWLGAAPGPKTSRSLLSLPGGGGGSSSARDCVPSPRCDASSRRRGEGGVSRSWGFRRRVGKLGILLPVRSCGDSGIGS